MNCSMVDSNYPVVLTSRVGRKDGEAIMAYSNTMGFARGVFCFLVFLQEMRR